MKKLLTLAVVALAFVGTGYCKTPTVVRNGIVINKIGEPQEVAMGGLNGFAMQHPSVVATGANVNCIRENLPASASWQEYIDTTCANVKAVYSADPNCQVIGTTRAILDYRVNVMGNDCHIYQLIIRDGKRAHIITATMKEYSWKFNTALKNELIDCVHSAHAM